MDTPFDILNVERNRTCAYNKKQQHRTITWKTKKKNNYNNNIQRQSKIQTNKQSITLNMKHLSQNTTHNQYIWTMKNNLKITTLNQTKQNNNYNQIICCKTHTHTHKLTISQIYVKTVPL